MIKEFKEFVLRGNVVDLAVGVAIGAAFGLIVSSLVSEIFSPLIGLLPIPDLKDAVIDLAPKDKPAGDIRYGIVLNNMISFLVTAAVIFFVVVKPVNHLMGRGKKDEDEPSMRECPHCMTSIRTEAKVCASCTRDVATKRR